MAFPYINQDDMLESENLRHKAQKNPAISCPNLAYPSFRPCNFGLDFCECCLDVELFASNLPNKICCTLLYYKMVGVGLGYNPMILVAMTSEITFSNINV